jgi:hypothetical protein
MGFCPPIAWKLFASRLTSGLVMPTRIYWELDLVIFAKSAAYWMIPLPSLKQGRWTKVHRQRGAQVRSQTREGVQKVLSLRLDFGDLETDRYGWSAHAWYVRAQAWHWPDIFHFVLTRPCAFQCWCRARSLRVLLSDTRDNANQRESTNRFCCPPDSCLRSPGAAFWSACTKAVILKRNR